MKQDIIKFDENIYQIDVFMENKPGRMSCYYIDSTNPILIEVGPSKSFPYLISSLESLGINEVKRSAMTHLHLDHIGGIGHLSALARLPRIASCRTGPTPPLPLV